MTALGALDHVDRVRRVMYPVRGVLELWFEERVPGSDPGPDGHRGGRPLVRYPLLGAYGASRAAIVRVRRCTISSRESMPKNTRAGLKISNLEPSSKF